MNIYNKRLEALNQLKQDFKERMKKYEGKHVPTHIKMQIEEFNANMEANE